MVGKLTNLSMMQRPVLAAGLQYVSFSTAYGDSEGQGDRGPPCWFSLEDVFGSAVLRRAAAFS